MVFRKKRKNHIGIIVFFLILIFFAIVGIDEMNSTIFPSAIEISHLQAKTTANSIIDKAVNDSIENIDLKSSDLFVSEIEDKGEGLSYISANTVLINKLCSSISSTMTDMLNKIGDEKIEIPFGALTGIEWMSNAGPNINFYLKPMGESEVDYETGFTSVGINQTSFQAWLNIKIGIKVVNPLQEEKIVLTRKIMLVDAVINGKVPDKYFKLN